MSLLDQLRLLDRALRDVRVREALRTGDRGNRRLARFAGSVAPADLAVLRAVDARRFEAVAQRQAEMIRDRWWKNRFPGVLAGAALAIQGTTRDVAQQALASPSFDKREGEDETGIALLGWLVGREDRTEDPDWLADLVAYEYLLAVGLPRRARNEKLDPELEQRVLPEGMRFLEASAKAPSKGRPGPELALARKLILLPVEHPVSELREALVAGQAPPDDLEASPHVLAFLVEEEGATELPLPAVTHDVLDMIATAPIDGARLLDAIDAEERSMAREAIAVLIDAGVLTGTLPPEPVEAAPSGDEDGATAPRKGKKGAKARAAAEDEGEDATAEAAPAPGSNGTKPAGAAKGKGAASANGAGKAAAKPARTPASAKAAPKKAGKEAKAPPKAKAAAKKPASGPKKPAPKPAAKKAPARTPAARKAPANKPSAKKPAAKAKPVARAGAKKPARRR